MKEPGNWKPEVEVPGPEGWAFSDSTTPKTMVDQETDCTGGASGLRRTGGARGPWQSQRRMTSGPRKKHQGYDVGQWK